MKKKSKKKVRMLPVTTENAAIIQRVMRERTDREDRDIYKGNPKDYVILVGETLMDCTGTFSLTAMDAKAGESGTVRATNPGSMAIVHKSKLAAVLGEKIGDIFWNKKLRMRRHLTPATPAHPQPAKLQDVK